MTVREVLLCCSASICYKGYSVWVQNSISYHLTGCFWILLPTQQCSNGARPLFCGYPVCTPSSSITVSRSEGWLSLRHGELGQSALTHPAELGTSQPGPHPTAPKQGRSGDKNEIQKRVEITQGSVKRSDKFMGMRQIWDEAGNTDQQVMSRVNVERVGKITVVRQFLSQTEMSVWVWVSRVCGQTEACAMQLQHSSDESPALQPSSSFLL